MGRGRAPCCAKVGLNKGSWTAEEDMRLIAYVQKHGHGNWRALPKLAGLLRCGKSCRLRWINYLRPDIKRGNFTREEEETIIKLHKLLGNKWSKIASFLPGRTDNEIKNVWNTHLKKRLAPEDEKPAAERNTNPDDEPSSPSSSTTFQGGNKSKEERNFISRSLDSGNPVIEIPVEPNMDMWSMLEDDDLSSTLLQPYNSSNITSSSSSTELFEDMNHEKTRPLEYITNREEATKDPLVVPDVLIDPADIWSMIEDDDDACSITPTVDITRSSSSLTLQEESSTGQGSSSVEWLDYLEEELGLREVAVAMEDQEILKCPRVEMEGDPVTCYFQKGTSSPTH